MTPRQAADRLRRAETEYRAAQAEHDGSMRATVRYQAAKRELEIAFDVAAALLDTIRGLDIVDESSDVTVMNWRDGP